MNQTRPTVLKLITIDGPAGSGKSTVSQMVAERLGWLHLNTGAIYRALGLLLHEASATVSDRALIETLTAVLATQYRQDLHTGDSFLKDRNVTRDLRSPAISEAASLVAKDEFVRTKLLPVQRRLVEGANGAVVDGRDMGTVVFPDAPLKVFLTASPEQRGRRRMLELRGQGREVELADLVREISDRDNRDANREVAPMIPAKDAIILDSTELDPNEVVNIILKHSRDRGLL